MFPRTPRFPKRPWSQHPNHQAIVRTESCFTGTVYEWADAFHVGVDAIRARLRTHGSVVPLRPYSRKMRTDFESDANLKRLSLSRMNSAR